MVDVFGGYRDKLAFIGGCAGRFGKPGDQAGPEDIDFALHHPVDIVADGVVITYWNLAGKIRVGTDGREAKRPAGFGMAGFLHESAEHGILMCVDVFDAVLEAIMEVPEIASYRGIDQAPWSHGRHRET